MSIDYDLFAIRSNNRDTTESQLRDCIAGAIENLNQRIKKLENGNKEKTKPTEPLIKDPKIRKAVRAWAEANRVAEARYSSCHDAECEFNARDDENKLIVFIGNFQEMNERLDITGRTIYTITELCREEEE